MDFTKEDATVAFLTLCLVAVAVALASSNANVQGPRGSNLTTGVFVTSHGNFTVGLEVADTPGKRERGLMNRTSLPEDNGMLFVFPSNGQRVFWMKNTLIPLDMVFVRANGTIANIEHADTEPGTPDDRLKRYRSSGPARYVVELNQGFTARRGINRGDRFLYR